MSGVFGNPWLYNPSSSFFTTSISNSLRFTAAQTPYLTFGQTKTPTDIAKWTVNFWLKRTDPVIASDDYDTVWGVNGPGNTAFTFLYGQLYLFINYADTGGQARLISDRKFLDSSAWYNFHVSFDRANSTNAHKVRFYVNGVEETSFATDERNLIDSNTSTGWNVNGITAAINRMSGTQDSRYHNGYLAQFYNIDGQALDPTSFIEISDGVCKPKDFTGTFGNQGWLLEFKESGVGTGASNTVGADTSGNDNHWTSVNVEAHDQTVDSPTNNWCKNNSNMRANITHSEGDLKMVGVGNNFDNMAGTFDFDVNDADGWYWEYYSIGNDSSTTIGIARSNNQYFNQSDPASVFAQTTVVGNVGWMGSGDKKVSGTNSSYDSSWTAGDIIGVAVKAGSVFFYKNGAIQNSGTAAATGLTGNVVPAFGINGTQSGVVNYGQDDSFAGNKTSGTAGASDTNGLGKFFYSVPSGHKALCGLNLPDVTIGPQQNTLATDHFDVSLWSSDVVNPSAGQKQISLNFQPDWVWSKDRVAGESHYFIDSVRGDDDGNKLLMSDRTNAEGADAIGNSTAKYDFTTSGFDIIDTNSAAGEVYYNNGDASTPRTYVGWCWKAGGATPTKTYKVVVDVDSGQNKYRFRNGANSATFATYAPTIELQEGGTYVFDWSDDGTNGAVSAQGHPIRFSTTSNGTWGGGSEYTTGVVKDDSAYTTTITVAAGAPTLYYYCQYHSGMGGQVNTNSTFGSSNFDGSILSVVSANQDAGFSIATYTGDNASGASTVGHGLGVAPSVVIIKRTDNTGDWIIGHDGLATNAFANNKFLKFATSGTNSVFTNSVVWGSQPTSSVVQITTGSGANNLNGSSATYVMYSFAEIEGYSKFGTYEGNSSSTDGSYVTTGFSPAWIMGKNVDASGRWWIYDNKRTVFNDNGVNNGRRLQANAITAESTGDATNVVLFFSNGFKVNTGNSEWNTGNTYLYFAFAEAGGPFKFSNAR